MYVTCTTMFVYTSSEALTAPSGDLEFVDANINAYEKMHGKDSQQNL